MEPEFDTSLATWTLASLNHIPYAPLSEMTQVGTLQKQPNKLILSVYYAGSMLDKGVYVCACTLTTKLCILKRFT